MLCNWKSLIYTFNKQTPLHIKVEGVQVENDANMSLQIRLKLNFLKNLLYSRTLFLFQMRREIWNARSQKLTEFHCLDRFCCVDVQGHTWELRVLWAAELCALLRLFLWSTPCLHYWNVPRNFRKYSFFCLKIQL